jgi:hypothetical protein
MMPKVTYDLDEYCRMTLTSLEELNAGLKERYGKTAKFNGLYWNGGIWVPRADFLSIFHEFIHHIIHWVPDSNNGSARFFIDFIEMGYDCVWGFVRYKGNRNRIWCLVDWGKTAWNDFLDFYLCRDVGV